MRISLRNLNIFTAHICALLCVLLSLRCAPAGAQPVEPVVLLLERAKYAEEVLGDLSHAIELYQKIAGEHPDRPFEAAQALLGIARCYEKLGDPRSPAAYERLLNQYPDQTEWVQMARARYRRLLEVSAAGRTGGLEVSVLLELGPEICNPTLSGDGTTMVYSDAWTGDLVLLDMGTKGLRHLTREAGLLPGGTGAFALASSVSQDGSRIASVWLCPGTPPEVRVCDDTGLLLHRWKTPPGWRYLHPGPWVPGEDRLFGWAVREPNHQTWICQFNLEELEPQMLARIPMGGPIQYMVYQPASGDLYFDAAQAEREYWSNTLRFSPGDTLFSWVSEDPGNDHLLTIDPQERYAMILGGYGPEQPLYATGIGSRTPALGVHRLGELPGTIVPLGTRADGAFLYVDHSGFEELEPDLDWVGIPAAWVVRWARYHHEEDMARGPLDFGSVSDLGLSREGAFHHMAQQTDFELYVSPRDPPDPAEAPTAAIEGPGAMLLSPFHRRRPLAAWAPDSRRIAYLSSRPPVTWFDHTPPLMIRNVETGEIERIPLAVDPAGHLLLWLPDGSGFLLSACADSGEEGIFRIDRASGLGTLVLPGDPGRMVSDHRSADKDGFFLLEGVGNSIQKGPSTRIRYCSWSGRVQETVFQEQGLLCGPPTRSPDGRHLAVIRPLLLTSSEVPVAFQILLISLDTGETAVLGTFPGSEPAGLEWDPTGESVRVHPLPPSSGRKDSPTRRPGSWIVGIDGRLREGAPLPWEGSVRLLPSPDDRWILIARCRSDRWAALYESEGFFHWIDSFLNRAFPEQ